MSERVAVQYVDLWYPRVHDLKRNPDEPQAVVVGLVDVRAADRILVEYDFERDGYKISMPTVHWWNAGDEVKDPKWAEVAFVPAWATAGMGDCECPACQEERADRIAAKVSPKEGSREP